MNNLQSVVTILCLTTILASCEKEPEIIQNPKCGNASAALATSDIERVAAIDSHITAAILSKWPDSPTLSYVDFDWRKHDPPPEWLTAIYEEEFLQLGTPIGFINPSGDTIIPIGEYHYCCGDSIGYFGVVAHPWKAINRKGEVLFKVLNTVSGEPYPDHLRYGMIRIEDENGKIGYANYRGEIVIEPQFEWASSFYKNVAIIGQKCKEVVWWHDEMCRHSYISCGEYGFINRKGEIQKVGKVSFGEVAAKIGWEPEEEEEW